MANTTIDKKKIASTTILMSGIILAALFIVLYFLEDKLASLLGNFSGKVIIGLMLFVMWITVGSAVRTINRHKRSTPFFTLLLSGVATAALGSALFTFFLYVFPKISKAQDAFKVAGASGGIILVMSGLGLIASLLAIINARVENKFLGNLLELLVIDACIAGFLYVSTK
jgi:ABC-type cobalamin transport system permease subunit